MTKSKSDARMGREIKRDIERKKEIELNVS